MPRAAKGPRLYLVAARRNAEGRIVTAARWVIRDGGKMLSTGCGEGDVAGTHQALADYLRAAHRPARNQRSLDEISLADVLSIYATDHVAQHPDRHRIAQRLQRILDWWGGKTLAQVTGATCRAYTTHRGNTGGARRDLQDLSAAIGHHHREGYHREIVKVALPKRGEARDRWLSRSEVAKLVWTMWRAREGSRADGKAGNTTEGRYTMRHLARFVLLAYSTASRPGAVLTASWEAAAGRSYIDLDRGVFYRLRQRSEAGRPGGGGFAAHPAPLGRDAPDAAGCADVGGGRFRRHGRGGPAPPLRTSPPGSHGRCGVCHGRYTETLQIGVNRPRTFRDNSGQSSLILLKKIAKPAVMSGRL